MPRKFAAADDRLLPIPAWSRGKGSARLAASVPPALQRAVRSNLFFSYNMLHIGGVLPKILIFSGKKTSSNASIAFPATAEAHKMTKRTSCPTDGTQHFSHEERTRCQTLRHWSSICCVVVSDCVMSTPSAACTVPNNKYTGSSACEKPQT